MLCFFNVMDMWETGTIHFSFKLLSSVFFSILHPPPVKCLSTGTCFALCASLAQTHRHVLIHALTHRDLQTNTHSKYTFTAICSLHSAGFTPAIVAMVTTLHVWIKHYITEKASLALSPSDSICLTLSLSILLHLLCSLILYKNVQSGEEMKMFYMDCTQDGVYTLAPQPLMTAGCLGSREVLVQLWDFVIYRLQCCIEC